jgi:hypothetical protein
MAAGLEAAPEAKSKACASSGDDSRRPDAAALLPHNRADSGFSRTGSARRRRVAASALSRVRHSNACLW